MDSLTPCRPLTTPSTEVQLKNTHGDSDPDRPSLEPERAGQSQLFCLYLRHRRPWKQLSEIPRSAPLKRVTHGMYGVFLFAARRVLKSQRTADRCSRRSKTKCSGHRPQCRRCLKRKTTCSWSRVFAVDTPDSLVGLSDTSSLAGVRESIPPPIPAPAATSSISHAFPDAPLLHRLLNIFYARHHGVEFCSFLHQPTTEITTLSVEAPFLVASIISLSALYIPKIEAKREFGFESAAALSDHYAQLAIASARSLSDTPSGKYYP